MEISELCAREMLKEEEYTREAIHYAFGANLKGAFEAMNTINGAHNFFNCRQLMNSPSFENGCIKKSDSDDLIMVRKSRDYITWMLLNWSLPADTQLRGKLLHMPFNEIQKLKLHEYFSYEDIKSGGLVNLYCRMFERDYQEVSYALYKILCEFANEKWNQNGGKWDMVNLAIVIKLHLSPFKNKPSLPFYK